MLKKLRTSFLLLISISAVIFSVSCKLKNTEKSAEINEYEFSAGGTETKTKNNDEITMYHYSETPPENFHGALRADSYVTPDKYENGSEAREKLAIPCKDDGSEKAIRYRYSVKVKPGEYRAAENSIPDTNLVAPFDGKKGGGTEFKTNVPLLPYKCETIPE